MVVVKNKRQELRILARNRCSNLIRKVRYGAITDRSEKLLDQEFVNSGFGGGKKSMWKVLYKILWFEASPQSSPNISILIWKKRVGGGYKKKPQNTYFGELLEELDINCTD